MCDRTFSKGLRKIAVTHCLRTTTTTLFLSLSPSPLPPPPPPTTTTTVDGTVLMELFNTEPSRRNLRLDRLAVRYCPIRQMSADRPQRSNSLNGRLPQPPSRPAACLCGRPATAGSVFTLTIPGTSASSGQ